MKALCRDCFWQADAAARPCPNCGSYRTLFDDELADLTIAHMDCDAFYASVEKRDRPELRDEPVIVGGGVRGVVTTCCYIARISGVRSAMPMFRARALCPKAVIIKPDFQKYRFESQRIFAMLRDLTPLVQTLSLDEAWMDLSGTARLHGAPPVATLARLQNRIEAETGLTVSIGLSANKFLAKIASDLDKPRGFAVIGAREAQAFLAGRPVSILPGVGPAAVRSLAAAGLDTVGDIAAADPKALVKRFGEFGLSLHRRAHGLDSRSVDPGGGRKAISAETTFDDDQSDLSELEDRLWPMCEKVARRIRAEGIAGRVATLKLRRTDFQILTRRRTLPIPVQTAKALFEATRAMLRDEAKGTAYRLIGAGLTDFVESASAESDLFAGAERKALAGERAIDSLRRRFGQAAVVTGRSFKSGR